MGGKKKKSLANRLARMTDEERARYMQHRADIEEEARRRKEQLIENFMKKKIKKEDGFARLNVAKINLYWHQVLRQQKCKDMKEDIEFLRKWMKRTVSLKNTTIYKLLSELEEAEEQYSNNFQAHTIHIEQMIARHSENIKELDDQYQIDLKDLLGTVESERKKYTSKSVVEMEYLLTLLYAQEVAAKLEEKTVENVFTKKLDDFKANAQAEVDQIVKEKQSISINIWKGICSTLREYVQNTDKRRFHLAELRRLDAEGALEIKHNQKYIKQLEEKLEKLKLEHETISSDKQEQIDSLEENLQIITKGFSSLRKKLQDDMSHDEKQLTLLSNESNATIDLLEKLLKKGQTILSLAQICRKYETEKEKVARWAPICDVESSSDETEKKPEGKTIETNMGIVKRKQEELKQIDKAVSQLEENLSEKSIEEMIQELKTEDDTLSSDSLKFSISPPAPQTPTPPHQTSSSSSSSSPIESRPVRKRPKTSIPKKLLTKFGTKPGSEEQQIGRISITVKPPKSAGSSFSSKAHTRTPKTIFDQKHERVLLRDKQLEGLNQLEGFWWVFGKVKLNCIELKAERKVLLEENNKMKLILKSILEDEALGRNVSSRVASHRNSN